MTDSPGTRFGWPALLAVAVIVTGAVLGVQAWMGRTPEPEPPSARPGPAVVAEAPVPTPEPDDAPAGSRIDDELVAHRAAEFRAVLEERFVSDTLDPEWSAKAETAVTAAAAEAALEPYGTPSDLRAKCTGHMCRIEIDFDDAVSAADWASFYPTSLSGTLAAVHAVVEPQPDGSARVVLIGARIGHNQLLMRPPERPAADTVQAPPGAERPA